MSEITAIFKTRGLAIRGAVKSLRKQLDQWNTRNAKEMPAIHAWLEKLWTTPDPDWTEEMARGKAQ